MSQTELAEEHSFLKSVLFKTKVNVLIGLRFFNNITSPVKKSTFKNQYIDYPIVSFSESEHWNPFDTKENWILTAGKIQNLRIASKKINGLEIKANEVFSFWKHLGNPNFGKGYVVGREIKEGCIVPTTAGGLCQLSNALYDAALKANFEIIERHRHTKVIQGSLAEKDRDATVKWNYIDLRFKSKFDFRIEVELTSTHLIVVFKSNDKALQYSEVIDSKLNFIFLNDCYSCGNMSCHQHEDHTNKNGAIETTTYILDEKWPEFDDYVKQNSTKNDVFILPLKKNRWIKTDRYNWSTPSSQNLKTTMFYGMYRALKLRFSKNRNPFDLSLELDQLIAKKAVNKIPIQATHLVISQNLLPFIYETGMLGGRTFDVLMNRLPLQIIQERLDFAHFIHPESKTLNDFRTDKKLIELETIALSKAKKIVSPHSEIQERFKDKIEKLNWFVKNESSKNKGTKILFPASTIGRKGAYEMRKLAIELNLSLVILSKNFENDNFWDGIETEIYNGKSEEIGLIIYPTLIENQPRQLLQYTAKNIPIITTTASGLQNSENVKIVYINNYKLLKEAVVDYLSIGKFSSAPHSDQEPS